MSMKKKLTYNTQVGGGGQDKMPWTACPPPLQPS